MYVSESELDWQRWLALPIKSIYILFIWELKVPRYLLYDKLYVFLRHISVTILHGRDRIPKELRLVNEIWVTV
jgi:hypothetical protein